MARVVVDVMLKPEILDPQGQAVANALPRLGVDEVASVRIGRRIELEFDGDPDPAKVDELAHRLLANPVIEDYTVTIDGHPAPRIVPAGPAGPVGPTAAVPPPGEPPTPPAEARAPEAGATEAEPGAAVEREAAPAPAAPAPAEREAP